MFLHLLLLSAALCAVPRWPSKYKFEGEFQVLEAGVNLPIIVNYDGAQGRQNYMYFNSTMEYVIRDGTSAYYYVHVQKDTQVCSATTRAADIPDTIEFLPDLTPYTELEPTRIRNIDVRRFQWVDIRGDINSGNHRKNIYTMYVDNNTDYPVRFDMVGYDDVFTSHYDHYVIEYYKFTPDFNDRGVYSKPSICSTRSESTGEETLHDRYGIFINNIMAPKKRFEEYTTKYGKTYASQEEAEYRYRVYQSNMETIAAINADPARTWRAAPNKFADMTMDEIEAIVLSKRGKRSAEPDVIVSSEEGTSESLPVRLDWRMRQGVSGRPKDQCACGSCWTFAAMGAMEGRYAIKNGLKDHLYFSEQFTMDCFWDQFDHGCNGGNSENVFNWASKHVEGYVTETDSPYIGINNYCNLSMSKLNPKYNVSSWGMVKKGDVEAAKQALQDGPLAVAISVPGSMIWYADGVYNDPTCSSDENELGHAVTLEGYDVDDEAGEFWIIKNSWSHWWGKDGYIYISTKNNLCGVATDASFPIY